MVKSNKDSRASAASSAADAETLRGQAEEQLDSQDFAAALASAEEALKQLPTSQNAWYVRGVAAAELWELEETESSQKQQLLEVAAESFDRVLALDTSKRSENRYLASLACGKLLTKAALDFNEEDPRGEQVLGKALGNFEEAARMHAQWGHPALYGEANGAWGNAFSRLMRLEMSRHQPSSGTEGILQLCASASAKFAEAAGTQLDPEEMGGDEDLHWLTLQVEHLLAFLDFAAQLIGKGSAEDLCARAEEAWREAASQAHAALQLSGETEQAWQALALGGDVFAAAAGLLSTREGSRLLLPASAGLGEAPGTAAAVPGPLVSCWARAVASIGEEEAAALAEEAYVQALAQGGRRAAAAQGLALGELLLARARRRQSQGSGAEELLLKAGEAFQAVAKLKGSAAEDPADFQAVALYNAACAAARLGKGEGALKALGMCFQRIKGAEARQWRQEAAADEDLRSLIGYPEMQQLLT